jgi:hypothetical protein
VGFFFLVPWMASKITGENNLSIVNFLFCQAILVFQCIDRRSKIAWQKIAISPPCLKQQFTEFGHF